MAHITSDRIKETTTVVGTGAATLLGAATGFKAFSAVCANGDTCWYAIVGQSGSTEWEEGLGTWGTGGILTRTTVLRSSNADAAVTFSAGTKDVFITAPADKLPQFAADGTVLVPGVAAEPTALPSAGNMKFYSKNIGGRMLLKWVGPSGVDTAIQSFLGTNHIRTWMPGNGAGNSAALIVGSYGIGFTAAGTTFAQTTPATGTLKSRTRLASITTAATAGAIGYIKGNQLEVARETGFFFIMRFGLDTLGVANLGFAGLYSSVTAPTATTNFVTATTARIGMACALNTGNWQLVIASGAAVTATDLGASFPINATDLLELIIFSAPGSSTMQYRVTNMTSGATTSGDFTMTNAPATTVYFTPLVCFSNNATAAAVKFSFKIMYLESDY